MPCTTSAISAQMHGSDFTVVLNLSFPTSGYRPCSLPAPPDYIAGAKIGHLPSVARSQRFGVLYITVSMEEKTVNINFSVPK